MNRKSLKWTTEFYLVYDLFLPQSYTLLRDVVLFFFFDFDMNDRSEETFLVVSFFYMFEVTCIKSKDTNFIYYYSAL